MSDIFAASLGEATRFYMDAPETPVLDLHTGEYYIPSTREAVEITVALLEPTDQEALVDYALESGAMRAHDIRLDDPVRTFAELRGAMAVNAIHRAMRADPQVQARHKSNALMFGAFVKDI